MSISGFSESPHAFNSAVLSNRPPQSESTRSPESYTTSFDLSIVVPAMNEQDSIDELHHRVRQIARKEGLSLEVIFIDDGSSDATWSKMSELAAAIGDPVGQIDEFPASRTLAIRMRRNFGKAAALSAGFAIARGDIVITMDADLQDDPDEIPRFIEALNGNVRDVESTGDDGKLDVVSGWKRVRHDPWHKVLPSRVFNAMVSKLTGVALHDHNCGFKAYRREVLQEIDLYGERHRFIPVLAAARGWRVGEIEVLHHPRAHGESKYGWSRIGKGFLDLMSIYLLTGFNRRPLHLIGTAGLACFATGMIGMVYLSAMWVLSRIGDGEVLHLHSTAVFYYCILAVLLGAQCVLAGLIAELIVSVAAARDRSFVRMQADAETARGSSSDPVGSRAIQNGSYSVSDTAGFRQ